jgi:hypothetical protein
LGEPLLVHLDDPRFLTNRTTIPPTLSIAKFAKFFLEFPEPFRNAELVMDSSFQGRFQGRLRR